MAEDQRAKLAINRILLNTTYLLPHEIPGCLFRVQQTCLQLMAFLALNEVRIFSMCQRQMVVAARAAAHSRPRRLCLLAGSDGRRPLAEGSALDVEAGQWEPLPLMCQARVQAAVAVACGHVFVCGGSDGERTLTSVETFEPLRCAWEGAPSLRAPRCGASAYAVEDKVYVLGGKDGEQYLSSAECLRPKLSEGVFHGRPGANMFFEKSHGDRFRWRMTNHTQGLVLDAMDFPHFQTVLRSKAFIPTTDTTVAVVTQGGVGFAESVAGLKAEFGGYTSGEGFIGVALRDVESDTWIVSKRRSFCGSSTWKEGMELRAEGTGNEETLYFSKDEIAGLVGREVTLDVIDTYHGKFGWISIRRVTVSSLAVSGEWEDFEELMEPRAYASAGKIAGAVLICGGLSSPTRASSSTELLALSSGGAWCRAEGPPLNVARACAASANLNGYFYVCGGVDGSGAKLDSVERLAGGGSHWEMISSISIPRSFSTATTFPATSKICLFGGFDGERYLSDVQTFEENEWRWKIEPIRLPGQRAFGTLVALEKPSQ